ELLPVAEPARQPAARLGVLRERVRAADDRAHRRAEHDVDRDLPLLERPQEADVDVAPRAPARQSQPDRPAGDAAGQAAEVAVTPEANVMVGPRPQGVEPARGPRRE